MDPTQTARDKPGSERTSEGDSDPERAISHAELVEHQAVLNEILQAIARAPADQDRILATVAESAARLCDAESSIIFQLEGEHLRLKALHGPIPTSLSVTKLGREWISGRAVMERRTIHIPDLAAVPETDFPISKALQREHGHRSVLATPLLTSHGPIGAIFLRRQEVRPFTQAQISLLESFANQAVIAIENARVIAELENRNRELDESLEHQNATAEVLRAINSSRGELKPVFETLLKNAIRLCDAEFGMMFQHDDGVYTPVALYGVSEKLKQFLESETLRLGYGTATGRAVMTKQTVHFEDLAAETDEEDAHIRKSTVELGGGRTIFSVPMLLDDVAIGAITIYRREVRPFDEKQIQLVSHFANHAVIAIENTRLLNELRESLEQQTATADILRVISTSPGDTQPVFDAIAKSAAQLCQARLAFVLRYDGELLHQAGHYGLSGEAIEWIHNYFPRVPDRTTAANRAVTSAAIVEIADIHADPDYGAGELADIVNFRSVIAVPMLRAGKAVGAICVVRRDAGKFPEHQKNLLVAFADQAVIAVENARLFAELQESLERQTATADILRVISTSWGDTQPVFDAIAKSAAQLCKAEFCFVLRYDGELLHHVGYFGISAEGRAWMKSHFPRVPDRQTAASRSITKAAIVEIGDVHSDPDYGASELAKIVNYKSVIAVPMLRAGEAVGAICLVRREAGKFPEHQVNLLVAFADQAVIAVENARLFAELQESLERQTATADILRVISTSWGDTQPVFDAIAKSAAQLCKARLAFVLRYDGELLHHVGQYGVPSEALAWMNSNFPHVPDRATAVGRSVTQAAIVEIADIHEDPDFGAGELARIVNFKSVIAVPMLRAGEAVGVISLVRHEAGKFPEHQVNLLVAFADQAVIAVENARLFAELQESLEQQTVTADVLASISRTSFDLPAVLQTLISAAAKFCEADQASVVREVNGEFRYVANFGFSDRFQAEISIQPVTTEKSSAMGRALLEKRTIHIPDVYEDPDYQFVQARDLGGFRTILAVPMMRDDIVIGALALTRLEADPFSPQQIDLVSKFADQASIAIENVRQFENAEARSRELAKSLEELRLTQDRLIQTEKLASLGQLTAGIAHEIKNPLNFVNNFSGVSAELLEEAEEILAPLTLPSGKKEELIELTGMLRANLGKIQHHGKRADSIIRNMLMHSRHGTGEFREVDVNTLVDEALNLAYHGARAENHEFNIELERVFDPAAGLVTVCPQEITRVLLNLISNGFYAARKRQEQQADGGFEPRLTVETKDLGDQVIIRVRDNGTGIPPEIERQLFAPFFTTKPVGEGTGLGLSISHDIIVKQHHGTLNVDTSPGDFTAFSIQLPRRRATRTDEV